MVKPRNAPNPHTRLRTIVSLFITSLTSQRDEGTADGKSIIYLLYLANLGVCERVNNLRILTACIG